SIDESLGRQIYEFDENAFTPNVLLGMSPGLILVTLRQPGRGQRSECSDQGAKQSRQRRDVRRSHHKFSAALAAAPFQALIPQLSRGRAPFKQPAIARPC